MGKEPPSGLQQAGREGEGGEALKHLLYCTMYRGFSLNFLLKISLFSSMNLMDHGWMESRARLTVFTLSMSGEGGGGGGCVSLSQLCKTIDTIQYSFFCRWPTSLYQKLAKLTSGTLLLFLSLSLNIKDVRKGK